MVQTKKRRSPARLGFIAVTALISMALVGTVLVSRQNMELAAQIGNVVLAIIFFALALIAAK